MIVFISFYKYKNNLLYLIFYGYCYGIFHICHKNWKIRENDTDRYFILDLNAIPMLKYRSLKKIDWACCGSFWSFLAFLLCCSAINSLWSRIYGRSYCYNSNNTPCCTNTTDVSLPLRKLKNIIITSPGISIVSSSQY